MVDNYDIQISVEDLLSVVFTSI